MAGRYGGARCWVAAAGILAVTEQVQHLQEDHENARQLARAIGDLPNLEIDQAAVQTNMVIGRVEKDSLQSLMRSLKEQNVLVSGFGDNLRLVTHFDFRQEQIERVASAISRALRAP